MNNEVLINKVKEDAEELFRTGGFYCSEAIVFAIRSNLAPEMPEEIVSCASGFPIGIGRSKCVCGAVSGGVICLGYFFGRTAPTNPQDSKSVKTLELANELITFFKTNHKVSCCSILTKGMDMASGEHKAQCISFTGELAAKTAQLILDNYDFNK